MKQFTIGIAGVVAILAFVPLCTPALHAAEDGIAVSGFTFPVDATPTVGNQSGPNYHAERTLYSMIFPCTVAFCGVDTNGFAGTVVTTPERVERIDRKGDRFFRMLAKQTITGFVVADGVTYSDCSIDQTLVATGGLRTDVPINEATATTVDGTWTITGNSTCNGGAVRVNGHGTLQWLGDPTMPPTYQGTIHVF